MVLTISDEIKQLRARADQIISAARAADRDLTDQERQQCDSFVARLRVLAAKQTRETSFAELLNTVNGSALKALPSGTPMPAGSTFGAMVARHDAVQDFLARRGGATPVTSMPFEVEMAAAALVGPPG